MRLDAPTLVGRLVRLEPLSTAHLPGLVAAAAESRDTYGFTAVPEGPDAMAAGVEVLLDAADRGEVVPFAQIEVVGDRVVGQTRFLDLHRSGDTIDEVEIGGTWLAASAQRTGLNREAKLLLMTHAFEVWGVGRIAYKTDARNRRSRSAIEGIGATFEGVLRHHQPSRVPGEEGTLRNTAVLSVTDDEWLDVRAALAAGLAQPPMAIPASRQYSPLKRGLA